MWTIGSHHWLAQSHHAAAQFQRHKMDADNHYAAILHLCAFKVIQPFNIKPFTYATVGPEPCHAGFYQRHAEWTKVFGNHLLAFFRRMLRETKFQVFTGDRFTTFQEWSRHCANTRAEKAENRIRKLYPKPEYTKPKPCEPVARM